MIQLYIEDVDQYYYYLSDVHHNNYKLNIEFYGLEKPPQVHDSLFLNEAVLKEKNAVLSFGLLTNDYGRKIRTSDDCDVAALLCDQELIYLKRFYG